MDEYACCGTSPGRLDIGSPSRGRFRGMLLLDISLCSYGNPNHFTCCDAHIFLYTLRISKDRFRNFNARPRQSPSKGWNVLTRHRHRSTNRFNLLTYLKKSVYFIIKYRPTHASTHIILFETFESCLPILQIVADLHQYPSAS